MSERIQNALAGTSRGSGSVEPPAMPPDRLNTLADGVFAIAMTLLVLELAVPTVSADELSGALGEMWPELSMYALSFMVLGMYWLIHHLIYAAIERYDSTLVWLNIGYLMFAALIPFSTSLVVEQGAVTITAIVYGLNLLVLFFMGWATWTYATADHRLVAAELDESVVRGAKVMGLVYFSVLALPLAIAVVSPLLSMIVYGAVVATFIGFTVAGRSEAVTVWSRGSPEP